MSQENRTDSITIDISTDVSGNSVDPAPEVIFKRPPKMTLIDKFYDKMILSIILLNSVKFILYFTPIFIMYDRVNFLLILILILSIGMEICVLYNVTNHDDKNVTMFLIILGLISVFDPLFKFIFNGVIRTFYVKKFTLDFVNNYTKFGLIAYFGFYPILLLIIAIFYKLISLISELKD